MTRQDKINYYLDIAQTVASRGTCLRRNYGAIIVNNDQIVATGYSGSPRGRKNCCDEGRCIRTELGIPRGERYELCRSVHAEANCIISASREQMLGGTIYLVGKEVETNEIVANASSCSMCKRLIINAGLEQVIIRCSADTYKTVKVQEWIDNDESLDGIMGY